MKKQFNSQKKQWITPSLKGQLEIKATLGGDPTGSNDAGSENTGKS